MKILVTGGAGYVGTSFIEEVEKLASVNEIIVLDNLIRQSFSFFIGDNKWEKVRFIKGDILDSILLEQLVIDVDFIFHFAAQVSHPYTYQQNVLYEQINRWGTLNLVRVVENSKSLKKFIYLSSTAVYGFKSSIVGNELPRPENSYGKSKFAGEQYVTALLPEEKIQIVRAGNVFGFNPCFREDSIINNFIFKSLVGQKLVIYGNGFQQRPFVYLPHLISTLVSYINGHHDETVKCIVDFNAAVGEVKNWIINYQNPALEYNFVNQNEEFEGQSFVGVKKLSDCLEILNSSYNDFQKNIRLSG